MTVIDADKDILDQKIEGLIKQLLDYRALLKDNIERTEKILCQVDLNETNFKNILAELDSKIDDQNNANKVSIENNRAMILGLKGDLDKYQAQFTLLVEADNANKESHENNKSMIIGLQNDFFKYQKQLSSLIEENNTNKTCNELNKSMIVDLQDELNRNRELFSKQSLSIDNNINSKASKINFYILAVLLLLNIVVSIVVYCYK
ncbi:MAG: hypothetical protein ACLTB7_09415 [Veillonella atypica]|uniref:hypothetical protein n=1 Tax=Veillonella atypica TaxID=39777 RepID=UPI003991B37B